MKLITYTFNNETFVGSVKEDVVVNLNGLLGEPSLTMFDLVERGLDFVKEIDAKIKENQNNSLELKLAEVTINAPLSNPGKVVCVGLNYMDHCREQNVEPPKKPLIFSKWPSCIVGPNENVILPEESKQVDYEAELGLVIGKQGKHISKENALDHVFGYLICNDVSARDVQFSDEQWVRGKSFDTFMPCGPYLVTADEIGDPQNLSIKFTLNGEVLQDSNTNEMIFDIKTILSYLSKGFTFNVGDLVSTGTPNGVGVFRNPQIFLKDGDDMVVEIEGLGTLRNQCVQEVESSVVKSN